MVRDIRTVCWLILPVMMAGGCGTAHTNQVPPPSTSANARSEGLQGKTRERVEFGRAHLAVGMSKDEVLEQIRLSRSQYEPLKDENSTELFIGGLSEGTTESDTWVLTCPTRNSHVLGGGSGIILKLRFLNDRVVSITELPWLAG